MKIVSGGQTGVDRAALDAAMSLGLEVGGWCPSGRRAEDGAIPEHYPLDEAPSERYALRTAWNVRDSDGTLILYEGELLGGTKATEQYARGRFMKPLLLVRLSAPPPATEIQRWFTEHAIAVLNVAGPRESSCPGIYRKAFAYLSEVLTRCAGPVR